MPEPRACSTRRGTRGRRRACPRGSAARARARACAPTAGSAASARRGGPPPAPRRRDGGPALAAPAAGAGALGATRSSWTSSRTRPIDSTRSSRLASSSCEATRPTSTVWARARRTPAGANLATRVSGGASCRWISYVADVSTSVPPALSMRHLLPVGEAWGSPRQGERHAHPAWVSSAVRRWDTLQGAARVRPLLATRGGCMSSNETQRQLRRRAGVGADHLRRHHADADRRHARDGRTRRGVPGGELRGRRTPT